MKMANKELDKEEVDKKEGDGEGEREVVEQEDRQWREKNNSLEKRMRCWRRRGLIWTKEKELKERNGGQKGDEDGESGIR